MQSKLGLLALSVMATLVLFGGDAAQAQSQQTDKQTVKETTVTTKKVDEKAKAKKASKPVIVTIKQGDTLADIAESHKTSYVRIFNANSKIDNPDMIYAGDKVRIPSESEKLPDRFSSLAPAVQAEVLATDATIEQPAASTVAPTEPQATAPAPAVAQSTRGSSAGNSYAYGWCTWYVKNMRPDLPNNLGNGGEWFANAAAQGIAVGYNAQAGAVAEIPGHVAYVESVNGNKMTISEMGWNYTQGQFNRRTVPAQGWRFIY